MRRIGAVGRRAAPSGRMVYKGTILPGFMMLSGSRACLMRAHRPHRNGAVLGLEIADLAVADAVLAGAGAAERERLVDHAPVHRLGARHLGRVVEIDQEDQVEVAVADVADQRREQAGLGDVPLDRGDAFGEP